MRLVILVTCASLSLAGCAAPPLQEDSTLFRSDGAFEAAVVSGGDLLRANEDPSGGPDFASLPLDTPDLDAAWGQDRYALRSIHWWGPDGAPELNGGQGSEGSSVAMPSGWQGFMVSDGHLQLVKGSVTDAAARDLADQFLENVTDLPETGRQQLIAEMMANCDVAACTVDAVPEINAAKAWMSQGGLEGATDESMHVADGILALDDWWFEFAFDEVTLEDGSGEGRTIVEVGSNDVVEFTWHSWGQHGDAESYDRLTDVLEEHGIDAPAEESVQWVHREAPTD